MSSGFVSRMWLSWVPAKMRDVAIFSECRETFRSEIYLPVITAWQRRFPGVVTSRSFPYVSTSLSSSFFLFFSLPYTPLFATQPSGIRSCPHYNGISCLHITLAVSPRLLHTFSPQPILHRCLICFLLQIYTPQISRIEGDLTISGYRQGQTKFRKRTFKYASLVPLVCTRPSC